MKGIQSLRAYFDYKLVVLLAAFYTVFEIIHLLKLSYFLGQNKMPWPPFIAGLYLIDWLLVISYMTFIAAYTKYLLARKVPWSRIFLMHFLFSIFISIIIRIALEAFEKNMKGESFQDLSFKEFELGLWANIDVNFLIYFAMVFIIYSYYYQEEIRKSEALKGSLEAQLLNTRMKMLTSQLQPHFLFNTLNGISSLVQINPTHAQDMIADLSDFLREILYQSDAKFTSVRNELNMLDNYLNLLKTRFWEQLNVEKKIEPGVLDKKMPSMLLQPVIENATKHGFSLDHQQLKISISVFHNNGYLHLVIENNGKEMREKEATKSAGVGLANIRERLATIYGSDYEFSLENRKEEPGVRCFIKLPLEK